MSIPLIDFRLGITERIEKWTKAHAQHRDVSEAHIAREVLQRWADEQEHVATLAAQVAREQSVLRDTTGGK